MSDLTTHGERDDLGGGRFRLTQFVKRHCFRNDSGYLERIVNDWVDGDVTFPHIITKAPMLIYTKGDGMRRICPTRDPLRYIEIGAPYIKPAGTWQQVDLGTPTRTGNQLAWTTAQANVYAVMGGHFLKLGILLKGGWLPPNNQFAFPVGLNGLTRDGANLLADGEVVAYIGAPHVEDYDNPDDRRDVQWDFVQIAGQWYVLFTLPSLAGMGRPFIDPTIIQPDETDGVDTFNRIANPDTNYGTDASLNIYSYSGTTDLRNSFLKFDLSGIPGGATVNSALLTLVCTSRGGDAQNVQLYDCLRNWVESQLTYNVYSSGNSWGTAGGTGAADRGSVRATTNITGAGSFDWTITAYIQTVIGGTANMSMFGVQPPTNAYNIFASSANATAANRPKLTVDYSIGGAFWSVLHQMQGGADRGMTGGLLE